MITSATLIASKIKSKFVQVDEKYKLIDIYTTEKEKIENVEEIHYYEEFKPYKQYD
jgi:hypothetical protein